MRAVVVGAGIGGLVAARLLQGAGLEVVVLEAHTYPGGLAGDFWHRGHRFSAGATLLSGFASGGPLALLEGLLGLRFPVEPYPEGFPLMEVLLPKGRLLRPVGREAEREAQRDFFGPKVLPFWRWQGERADRLKALAPRLPWPPEREEIPALLRLFPELLPLLPDLFRRASRLAPEDSDFRLFLRAQLLIAAQTEDPYALYAALALDLPHLGPARVPGGVGGVARALAEGLGVRYRARATRLLLREGRAYGVEVAYGGRRRGEKEVVFGDFFLLNVPPEPLLGLPQRTPKDAWGAFALYGVLPFRVDPPFYRQNARERPFAFLSLFPEGERTVFSLSLHTPLAPWEGLEAEAYRALKAHWQERALALGEELLPGLREAELLFAATPRTYRRFAGRAWVGGYPQTHPFRFPRVRLFPNVFRVGEGVFPGQSVPAAALSGLRAARLILRALGLEAFQRGVPEPLGRG
ncbi:phytoene desaturase family protein [Thermus tengchongensis]|uniref:Phytoene dehydrogenase n=1 Tax=Thermus tengchongensis TaxID=1214928 RepID=A0A4Y9FDK9_9DEIN|nr:FAD-dependent oxidoreductase [Thermus tengchongensis]TFU26208.1 phytoene dehydrogenase [Thermus tengchongensis]